MIRPYAFLVEPSKTDAHIIEEDASELTGELCLAKRLEATVEDIISTVHAHPTMHEGIHEAALAWEGRLIHG